MNAFIGRLDRIPYKIIVWVLAVTETLHNLEEAIWLPKWSQGVEIGYLPDGTFSVGAFEFRFAVTFITLCLYGIFYYFSKSTSKLSGYLIGGVIVMIFLNVFMPHLIGTILLRQYTPGVITGIILNVPVCLYLLQRGIKEGVFNNNSLIISGLVFILFTIPLLQISFFLGRIVSSII